MQLALCDIINYRAVLTEKYLDTETSLIRANWEEVVRI
jgi:hypothetical protein